MREHIAVEFSDEEFEACCHPMVRRGPICGSRIRLAYFFLDGTRQIGCYCDQGHLNKWGGVGQWIAHDLFAPGGPYEGMAPHGYFPENKTKKSSASLKLNEQSIYKVRALGKCVACGCKPFDTDDQLRVFAGIEAHRPELFKRLLLYVTSIKSPDHNRWIDFLPTSLADDVAKAKRDSRIHADHGIPRSILERMNAGLSTAERRLATTSCALPLCGYCNRMRRDGLYSTERLMEYFVEAYYGGNRQVAIKTAGETFFAIQAFSAKVHRFVEIEKIG